MRGPDGAATGKGSTMADEQPGKPKAKRLTELSHCAG
jgi:hypothetical protein